MGIGNKKYPCVGVGVMLLRDGKVILGKRSDDPEKAHSKLGGAGTWTMPGGGLEFGERLDECVCREVLEETGIKVDKSALKLVSVSDDIAEGENFVTVGFLCEEFEGEARAMEPEVITEWKWFPLDGLPSPLFFPSERVLKNYLAGKVY